MYIHLLFLMSEALHLLDGLRGRSQVFTAVLGDVNVILDTHTSHAPVPLQNIGIDVLAKLWRLQDRVNNEAAEVNLADSQSCIWSGAEGMYLTPGSTVITAPAGRLRRTRRYRNILSLSS